MSVVYVILLVAVAGTVLYFSTKIRSYLKAKRAAAAAALKATAQKAADKLK